MLIDSIGGSDGVFHECDFVSEIENLHMIDEEMGADNSIAGTLFRRGVCMPSNMKIAKEDMERICGLVRKLWERADVKFL